MFISKIVKFAIPCLLFVSFSASAELVIQSAQWKAEKGSLFVKGTVEGATAVYVVDATRRGRGRPIAMIKTKKDQFKDDIVLSESQVPCLIQVLTESPLRRMTSNVEMSVAPVRHSPNCQD